MAESIISGVIAKLLEYLGESAVEVIAPFLGGRHNLKELNRTMRLIQARLLDAEKRGEGDKEAVVKEWMKRLKDIIYRLEDLFEEVAMADEGDEQLTSGKLIKYLCSFSSSSPVKLNTKVVREANIIVEELKAIESFILITGSSSESPLGLLSAGKLRSLLLLSDSSSQYLDTLFSRMRCLRSLDLFNASCKILPISIEELKHLRYVRLGSGLESLPYGITKLRNLFTLDISLFLTWSSSYLVNIEHVVNVDEEEEVLKWLQPPTSVKRLKVWSWKGLRFPQWGMNEFPFLVFVSIISCHRCHHLPSFSSLPHLKLFRLYDLGALEYIESRDDFNGTSSVTEYFPSLESLLLSNLPELKGWSKLEDNVCCPRNGCQSAKPRFRCLSVLGVEGCPKLMSMPMVPKLDSLNANEIHGSLLKDLLPAEQTLSTLNWLHIHAVQKLFSLLINVFTVVNCCSHQNSLQSLTISECQELTHLIANSSTSLHRLVITECCQLSEISSALQHLPDLKELEIQHCEVLDLGYTSLTAWHALKNLYTLELRDLPKLEMLPEGVGSLVLLQRLKLVYLTKLKALPDCIGNLSQLHLFEILECPILAVLPQSFGNLTSLQELRICNCPDLQRRCECPNGDDWPLILHIPDIYVG
ncbi:putative disease resistance protein RGA4 [Bienertia sinuspersici]